MELHLAIKNILKYQGVDFLLDPKMINALMDFQAYDQHPALKNIFRTLHQDGYVKKVRDAGKWDASCDQMVYEIERDYAFPHDIIELTLKNIAVGLGYNCILPNLSSSNQSRSNTNPPAPSTPSAPLKQWSNMTVKEKEKFLNSFVEIRPSNCGLEYVSVYLADRSSIYSKNDIHFDINYELKGKLTKSLSINFMYAVYDRANRIRQTEVMTSTLSGKKGKEYDIIDHRTVSLNFRPKEIGKILLFLEES